MTVKEKLKNAKDKTVKFCRDHKKAIIGTLAGVGAFGLGLWGVQKMKHGVADSEANLLAESTEEEIYEQRKSAYDEHCDAVREERADDFEKMFEFVDSFDVKDGEAWIIAAPNSEYNMNTEGDPDIYLVDRDEYYIYGERPQLEEPKELQEA